MTDQYCENKEEFQSHVTGTAPQVSGSDDEFVPADVPATTPAVQIIAQDVAPSIVQEEPVARKPEPVTDTSVKSDPCCAGWLDLSHLGHQVNELIYWTNPCMTGGIFGSILAILVSLISHSCISVFTYASLAVLLITIFVRIFKSVLQAILKSGNEHPYKKLLETDLALPADKVHEFADAAAARLNSFVAELRRLFLVEDIVDSIKLAIVLWVSTYIGAMFNGLTLIILGVVGLFTLPKVYQTHQDTIDQSVDYVRRNIEDMGRFFLFIFNFKITD